MTTQTITVPIIGDTIVEPSEFFFIVLSNLQNASGLDIQGVGNITDNVGGVSGGGGQGGSSGGESGGGGESEIGNFDIVVVFGGGLSASQEAAFTAAEHRWEQLIIGDVPDVNIPGVGFVDDVQISVSSQPIDGSGGILGQAGPMDLRNGSFLPATGVIQFDTADLQALESSGRLEDVILHEMAHVLGFGTIWSDLGLLLNPAADGSTNPRFTGALATQEFNTTFHQNASDVPVETIGGPGTADAHWRESIFDNELMTGFINSGTNPLSRITVASMADLGYEVNLSQSDAFLVASPPSNVDPVQESSNSDYNTVIRPTTRVLSASTFVQSTVPAIGAASSWFGTTPTVIANNQSGSVSGTTLACASGSTIVGQYDYV